MDRNRIAALRKEWEAEEKIAHVHGWDFSHIHGKYEEENDLPWDYEKIVLNYLRPELKLLDFDTGGGEFLLSLGHPNENTSATEGYPPNVTLCRERLLPLGIDFRECADESDIPFEDSSFDLFLNRHGSFDPEECFRLLKPNGLFITEQVGSENDRDLVAMVLPELPKPFSDLNLRIQRKRFEEAGFEILTAEEAFRPILFYDIGAFVWFAHIIEWEFTGFSVETCFDRLLNLQERIDRDGKIEGTIHRYLIVAKRPG
jgi:SAM-dependent methyltransferase